MKETIHASIGGMAFTLDEDAYQLLDGYFKDIRSRLPEGDTETMADIEARMAELFRERLTSPMRVITIEMVRATMARMGAPSDFGEIRNPAPDPDTGRRTSDTPESAPRRLYRSRTERSIAGVCGGLAAFFEADPTMIRLLMLVLILFGGLSIWAYIILWIVIPEEPLRTFDPSRKNS